MKRQIDWPKVIVWGFIIFVTFCIWNGIVNVIR